MTRIFGSDQPVSSASATVLRFLAKASDAGYGERIDGGRVLEWIDKAGYACATGWSGLYCVTAYVGNIRFALPIAVGDLVEIGARVVHTGRSSMHILVSVSSGAPHTRETVENAQCLTVFVAVDENGKPARVPSWSPRTVIEQRRHLAARRRITVRADIEAAMATQTYDDGAESPSAILRFLAVPTDVNWGGKVHGGNLMRWIDEAAFVCASQWSRQRAIAAYVGGIRFYRPLPIGNKIEVTARLIHTSDTRMHIDVHVRSINPRTGAGEVAAHGLAIFVALDKHGRATTVPRWLPVTDEDRRLDQHAQNLLEIRRRAETA
ncbi:acyl-CoA thioesterase [Antrihabitans sp. YC3-6]|uniref:Acyl-CoA thioesterase n=1 Tax=Antrihabitans stalagmiti TaxID=2799499 RepID=A0A934U6F1_9NOCA|nr:acyl-CoA thioesterase [Antrihabitans stalagmiti]MBJ8341853.1 acyl-CoA thioesterase [Antrihabitans stalagmiti]